MSGVTATTWQYGVQWDDGELEDCQDQHNAELIVKLHHSCHVVQREVTTITGPWRAL